ncbi:MAG TPA: N-methyl-L-tryptophan oxidase [Candidatus Limnocylindrales bacterium]|nr:N-methyl-L-tryptophan oxidase [Candidatus Limnocylindrales bacterium]
MGSYDAIVIGLGALGSAAACRLATAPGSWRVLGLEQFELNHDKGASQDVSRITRVSYHRREYVELAVEAQAAWAEIEQAAGTKVITFTGGLDLGPPDAPEDIDDYARAMTEAGISFEWFDDVDISRRWPVWRLSSGTRGIFQERGGIADPERGNPAHQHLAREAGAELREHARVTAIRDHGSEYEVVLEDGRAETAGSVVIATDAWTNDLTAPLGYEIPLSVTREQVTWYEATDPAAFEPDRFPIWIWLGQPSFYGFPTYRGPGPKIGEDIGGRQTTARTRTFDPDLDCLDRTGTFMRTYLPGAIGAPAKTKTCLYTLTPDRDFVLDRLPEHPGVIVALGAAHSYKFAALFGKELASLALDARRGPRAERLALFGVDRPALRNSNSTNLVETA